MGPAPPAGGTFEEFASAEESRAAVPQIGFKGRGWEPEFRIGLIPPDDTGFVPTRVIAERPKPGPLLEGEDAGAVSASSSEDEEESSDDEAPPPKRSGSSGPMATPKKPKEKKAARPEWLERIQ